MANVKISDLPAAAAAQLTMEVEVNDSGTSRRVTAAQVDNLVLGTTNGFVARTGTNARASRTITAGAGISVSNGNGASGNPTITNTAPDVPVTLAAGTGITVTGSYPSFTISNTAEGVGSHYQEFTSSGTWTKPAGVTWVYVEAIGGGGSGGVTSRTDTSTQRQGGLGGLFVWKLMRASDLAGAVSVTVGAGGASVTISGNSNGISSGNDGGDSSFGSHLTAFGGAGGNISATEYGVYFGLHNGGGIVIKGGAKGGNTGSTSAGSGSQSLEAGDGGDAALGDDANAFGLPGLPGGGGGGAAAVRNRTISRIAASGAGGAGRVRVWAW